MTRSRIGCLVVGWLLAIPSAALGWGDDGHRITAAIAEARLSATARTAIAELLDGRSLTEIATWADDIKRESAWRWAKGLHYANVPPSAEAFDLARDCPGSECVVSAIMGFAHTLRDPDAPRQERVEALKFLVHFVADAHQPLHVGYARDRGGNSVEVTLAGQKTNLHRAWDSDLLDQAGVPWQQLAATLTRELPAQELDARRAGNPGDIEALSPAAWAAESYALVRTAVYEFPADGTLDDAYRARSLAIMHDRLQQGGARLAALLDLVFDDQRALPFAVVHLARSSVSDHLFDPRVIGGGLAALVAVIVILGVRRRLRRSQRPIAD